MPRPGCSARRASACWPRGQSVFKGLPGTMDATFMLSEITLVWWDFRPSSGPPGRYRVSGVSSAARVSHSGRPDRSSVLRRQADQFTLVFYDHRCNGRSQGTPGPTLIVAGRDDFIFPPEHQRELAAAIPHAHLQLIERAGHNPHTEQPAEVMRAIRDFISP
jgi:alpha/beta hydrolase fold